MILSVSRRTDIPSHYFDWFLNRLEEGSVLVRNPMNFHQVSRVDLSPEVVDCIVFWTKNPAPMLDKLDRLKPYPYYIQFTINPYENDLERNLPDKETLLDTFDRLSSLLGPERVVWRYSPVILNKKYTPQFHLDMFARYAERLAGKTEACNLSFVEVYGKIRPAMDQLGTFAIPEEEKNSMARAFHQIASQSGIELRACGNLDLAASGIRAAKCIDDGRISRITGERYHLNKDRNQPPDCYCVPSVDVGAYNTCLSGCLYCYANRADVGSTQRKSRRYDPSSPLLCSALLPEDRVTDRAVKREGSGQMGLF